MLARQLKAKLQCTIRKADASTCNPQQVKSRTEHRVITDALFSHLRRLETKNEEWAASLEPAVLATGALNYNLAIKLYSESHTETSYRLGKSCSKPCSASHLFQGTNAKLLTPF